MSVSSLPPLISVWASRKVAADYAGCSEDTIIRACSRLGLSVIEDPDGRKLVYLPDLLRAGVMSPPPPPPPPEPEPEPSPEPLDEPEPPAVLFVGAACGCHFCHREMVALSDDVGNIEIRLDDLYEALVASGVIHVEAS